jgi:hypothetical protein
MTYFIKCQYSGEIVEIEKIDYVLENKYRIHIQNRPWSVLIDISIPPANQPDEFYNDKNEKANIIKIINQYNTGIVAYVSTQEKIQLAKNAISNLEHILPTQMNNRDRKTIEGLLDQLIELNSIYSDV